MSRANEFSRARDLLNRGGRGEEGFSGDRFPRKVISIFRDFMASNRARALSACVTPCALTERRSRWSDYIACGNGKFHVTLIDLSHFRNYRWTARLILVITHDIPVSDYLLSLTTLQILPPSPRTGWNFPPSLSLIIRTSEISLPRPCRGIESEK